MRQCTFNLVLMIAAWQVSSASGSADDGGPIRLPAGVVDPTGATGYFLNEGGGIDAVDLPSGKRLWTRVEIGMPLFVAGDRLLLVGRLAGNPRCAILARYAIATNPCALRLRNACFAPSSIHPHTSIGPIRGKACTVIIAAVNSVWQSGQAWESRCTQLANFSRPSSVSRTITTSDTTGKSSQADRQRCRYKE